MKSLLVRARWAAIGAAVSALFVGGVGVANATLNSGERPVLVTITPCRLVDTRPATRVGPRNTPLGAQQYMTVNARGKQGNCNLPSDAIGLSLNVTATDASKLTNLRIYPADAPVPLASNLNPSPFQEISWNAVTTDLSGAGQFRVFNWTGSVNVIVDVAGYYVNHAHDDRYYTKAQSQAGLATKANAADVYTKTQINAALATKANASEVYTKSQVNLIADTKADKTTVNAGFASVTAALANKADKANTYTKAETDLAIDAVAVERTARFDKQLDQRTVAAGRFNGDGSLGRATGNVVASGSGGTYTLTITAPEACETGNAPVVTATAVNSAAPIVVNVVTDPVTCTNNAFSVQIKTYNLAGTATAPQAVLFTAIGTNWPDPDVTP